MYLQKRQHKKWNKTNSDIKAKPIMHPSFCYKEINMTQYNKQLNFE